MSSYGKMPRVRPRCIFIYFVSIFGCLCVIFNIHQVYFSFPIMSVAQQQSHIGKGNLKIQPTTFTIIFLFLWLGSSEEGGEILDNLRRSNSSLFGWFQGNQPQNAIPQSDQSNNNYQSNQDAKNKDVRARTNLPYFMRNGSNQPEIDKHPRSHHLFPEESPGDDRIVGNSSVKKAIFFIHGSYFSDQLMFLPPDLPKNEEDPEKVPLKTILMWNGVRSWGVQGGRGEFLKQNCPVSNCALVSDKNKQDSADLILFKVRYCLSNIFFGSPTLYLHFSIVFCSN